MIIFQLSYASSGSPVAKASHGGTTRNPSWMESLPSPGTLTATHTHTGTTWTGHSTSGTHVGGVGGNQSTGRRHADVGRMCKLHPERGPARNDFFPPSSSLEQKNMEWNSIIREHAIVTKDILEATDGFK